MKQRHVPWGSPAFPGFWAACRTFCSSDVAICVARAVISADGGWFPPITRFSGLESFFTYRLSLQLAEYKSNTTHSALENHIFLLLMLSNYFKWKDSKCYSSCKSDERRMTFLWWCKVFCISCYAGSKWWAIIRVPVCSTACSVFGKNAVVWVEDFYIIVGEVIFLLKLVNL